MVLQKGVRMFSMRGCCSMGMVGKHGARQIDLDSLYLLYCILAPGSGSSHFTICSWKLSQIRFPSLGRSCPLHTVPSLYIIPHVPINEITTLLRSEVETVFAE